MATKTKTRLVIPIDYTRISRGHQSHRGGSGTHGDKRTKRNRTRGDQRRFAIREQGY